MKAFKGRVEALEKKTGAGASIPIMVGSCPDDYQDGRLAFFTYRGRRRPIEELEATAARAGAAVVSVAFDDEDPEVYRQAWRRMGIEEGSEAWAWREATYITKW